MFSKVKNKDILILKIVIRYVKYINNFMDITLKF